MNNRNLLFFGLIVVFSAVGAMSVATFATGSTTKSSVSDELTLPKPDKELNYVRSESGDVLRFPTPSTPQDKLEAASDLVAAKVAAYKGSDELCRGSGRAYASLQMPAGFAPSLEAIIVGADAEDGISITKVAADEDNGMSVLCVEDTMMLGITSSDLESINADTTLEDALIDVASDNNVSATTSLNSEDVAALPAPIVAAGSSFGAYLVGGGAMAVVMSPVISSASSEDDRPASR